MQDIADVRPERPPELHASKTRRPSSVRLRPRAASTTAVSTASASRADPASSSPYVPLSLAGPSTSSEQEPPPQSQSKQSSSEVPVPESPLHPFANTKAKLELIPSANGERINVEEEAQLYDDLRRAYEDENNVFTRSSTQPRQPSAPGAHARPGSTLARPRSTTNPAPRPPSLPPESIFSADIFLADNTSSALSTGAPLFAQDVRIGGWTTVGDGGGAGTLGRRGAGSYVAYDCAIVMREGTTMHVLKRYTAFEELHEQLKRTLPRSLLPSLPALPPKAPLARFRPAFLDARRQLLQFWLTRVLLHPEIGGREAVREWVLS